MKVKVTRLHNAQIRHAPRQARVLKHAWILLQSCYIHTHTHTHTYGRTHGTARHYIPGVAYRRAVGITNESSIDVFSAQNACQHYRVQCTTNTLAAVTGGLSSGAASMRETPTATNLSLYSLRALLPNDTRDNHQNWSISHTTISHTTQQNRH